MSKKVNIPLIISGPPRSGTTFFHSLFDGHSDINWLVSEGYFFEHVHHMSPDCLDVFVMAAQQSLDDLVAGIRDREIMPKTRRPIVDFPALEIDWSEEDFRESLAKGEGARLQELWDMLVGAYLAGFGFEPRLFACMKAADYGASVWGALENFGDARGIIVVREPLRSLNSLKAYRLRRNEKLLTWPTLAQAVASMNRMVARIEGCDPERIRWVRFEDLLGDRKPIMGDLCKWLGIPFDEGLLTPSMLGVPWTHNSSFAPEDQPLDSTEERPLSALTDGEISFIERATKPFREYFGYSLEGYRSLSEGGMR